jgi:hypothetical protein
MAHFVHDGAGVLAERVEQRTERPPQRVRRQLRRQRRQVARCEVLVRALDCRGQDAVADILGAEAPARPRREHERVVIDVSLGSEREELVAQRASDLHAAPPRVGLALPRGQPAAGQVHVAPAQRQELSDSQAGERQRGEHRAALDVPFVLRRLRVELAGVSAHRVGRWIVVGCELELPAVCVDHARELIVLEAHRRAPARTAPTRSRFRHTMCLNPVGTPRNTARGPALTARQNWAKRPQARGTCAFSVSNSGARGRPFESARARWGF